MREPGRRDLPIHVLIHIQPSDTMFLPSDHVASYYRAACGVCIRGLRGFRGAAVGEDSGVWQRLLSRRWIWSRDN